MGDIKLNIDDNVINIFSNKTINEILKELNLTDYYETRQTHSDIVHIVDDNYVNKTEGDALITNLPNKPIIIKIADCVPIILYDKENKVIAVVHSGWKGTLQNITTNTINTMITKFNSKKENKYYIDLQSIIKDNLKEIGIDNIIDTNICTYCNHNIYHSYRYNHTDKRNILLAMIKE